MSTAERHDVAGGHDPVQQPFSTVFASALRGTPCSVVGLGASPQRLPTDVWTRDADDADLDLVGLCDGWTIDIGCGPGRLTAALRDVGTAALGIDVVREAVGQTRSRGAAALRRDVFDQLPGEGHWRTALLADGNVGIGGDPAALLRRVREILDPRGRVVVEVEPAGVATRTAWVRLECAGAVSRPFRWTVLGMDGLPDVVRDTGLELRSVHRLGHPGGPPRWAAVLGVFS